MSGILKGDSIYKNGGGGGGYKDGGALVDGDFIKVENNSISNYTNTSRTDINFYFEVKDGEPINAIIELANEYNATVHVYIVQNGLFIPLGNVGGDTVNAGDDYKINVVGDSFMLEVVTPAQADPEAVIIDGVIYSCKRIGSKLWLKSNFRGGDVEKFDNGFTAWYKYPSIRNVEFNGWRLPVLDDIDELRTAYSTNELKSVNGWEGDGDGNNNSGMSIYPYGSYIAPEGRIVDENKDSYIMYDSSSNNTGIFYMEYGGAAGTTTNPSPEALWVNVRLVHD